MQASHADVTCISQLQAPASESKNLWIGVRQWPEWGI
jgi:hypothetical protein